ncbi:hypothetical protein ACA910_018836 [Epithemia clementina (nom. ined.)]
MMFFPNATISFSLILLLSAAGIVNGQSKKSRHATNSRRLTYWVGLWEAIDPLDGAQHQRSFIASEDEEGSYTLFGRIEFSQICGSGLIGNITEAPSVTANLIPALLTGSGSIDDGDGGYGILDGELDIICFGKENKTNANPIEVTWEPLGMNLIKEIPKFRAADPLYFSKVSQPFKPF